MCFCDVLCIVYDNCACEHMEKNRKQKLKQIFALFSLLFRSVTSWHFSAFIYFEKREFFILFFLFPVSQHAIEPNERLVLGSSI